MMASAAATAHPEYLIPASRPRHLRGSLVVQPTNRLVQTQHQGGDEDRPRNDE